MADAFFIASKSVATPSAEAAPSSAVKFAALPTSPRANGSTPPKPKISDSTPPNYRVASSASVSGGTGVTLGAGRVGAPGADGSAKAPIAGSGWARTKVHFLSFRPAIPSICHTLRQTLT